MQFDLQKVLNSLLIVLAVAGGIVTGMLAGRLINLSLGEQASLLTDPLPQQPAARRLQDTDFQIILSRNLFNSNAVGEGEQIDLSGRPVTAEQTAKPSGLSGDLSLVGTIVADAEEDSLALIQAGSKTGVFKLGAELAPGVTVVEITRKMVVLKDGGVRRELLLKQRKDANPRMIRGGKPVANSTQIVEVGENRWQIPKAVVENARENLSSLLQTARMVPEVKDGKTIGFSLVGMKRGSLLERIGLRVGDLIVEINQVELNSPEKALQVFQQVRDASNISIGLIRNGQPETFEYSFE